VSTRIVRVGDALVMRQRPSPDAHAFASGTVWSMSKSCATDVVTPDQGSTHFPVATVHCDVVVYVMGASRRRG